MRTITFYSYKGGVGRSLALANMATRLVEFNKKVCLLDFDLEAPGLLHKFSHITSDVSITNGIVDYIYDYSVSGHLNGKIKPFSIDFRVRNNGKPVTLIPAGNTDDSNYWKKLSSLNLYKLLYESEDGLSFFLDLKEKIKKEINPDYLLIDSRTGITDISGITLSILADDVVALAANNDENFYGIEKVLKSISNPENAILGLNPNVVFVLSRVPFTERKEDRQKEHRLLITLNHRLGEFANDINVIHSDRDLEEREHLKMEGDINSSSSQVARDYLNLFERLFKKDFSENELEQFKSVKESERLFAESISEKQVSKKLTLVNEAITLNPNNKEFYEHKLEHQIQLGYFDEAQITLSKILELEPNNWDAINSLGVGYSDKRDLDQAINLFKRALQIEPKEALLWHNIANSYCDLGDYQKALSYNQQAIEIDPAYSSAYNGIADAYCRLKEFQKALEYSYKAIELNSGESFSFITLAEIYAEMGREQDFFINLERGLELLETDEKSHFEKLVTFESVYKKYYDSERFKNLLERFGIFLPLENKE